MLSDKYRHFLSAHLLCELDSLTGPPHMQFIERLSGKYISSVTVRILLEYHMFPYDTYARYISYKREFFEVVSSRIVC